MDIVLYMCVPSFLLVSVWRATGRAIGRAIGRAREVRGCEGVCVCGIRGREGGRALGRMIGGWRLMR